MFDNLFEIMVDVDFDGDVDCLDLGLMQEFMCDENSDYEDCGYENDSDPE